MRHLKSGRKLGVSAPHRIARLRSLTLAIIERDAIRTTPARAKELRWYAERVVTLAKRGDLAGRRHIVQLLGSTETHNGTNRVREAVTRVYTNLVPRFQTRPGGYTQILLLTKRRPGDNAEMCVIRYLPPPEEKKGGTKKKTSGAEGKEKKVHTSPHAKPPKAKKSEAKGAEDAEDKKGKAKKKDK